MKAIEWNDSARLRGKPLDGIILHGHGKNAKPISLEE
jgi:hypothetical protein